MRKKNLVLYTAFVLILCITAFSDILEEIEQRFIEIHQKVGPSVVNIERETKIGIMGINRDELFKKFGLPVPEEEKSLPTPKQEERHKMLGTGSGVIFSKDGYIITNNHVVEGADKITVKTASGTKYSASIVGSDAESDLAVIKIEPQEELIPATLGDSDNLKVGQFVAAIGSARGLEGSISFGHISALGRENLRDLQLQGLTFQHLIQTDAGINLGNSGGPLVNIKGEVVGINVALMLGANRIGFAIPINTVKKVVPQLIQSGKVYRGYIGVAVADAERFASALNLPKSNGAFIKRIQPNTPAEKAGLQVYDVILKVNDEDIDSAQDLVNTISSFPPGTQVNITFWRDNELKTLPVELAERNLASTKITQVSKKPSFLGMTLIDLNKENREKFDINKDVEGILIESISADSPAIDAGLMQGDVILEIQKKKVTSIEDFNTMLPELIISNKPILIKYQRGKEEPDITVISLED